MAARKTYAYVLALAVTAGAVGSLVALATTDNRLRLLAKPVVEIRVHNNGSARVGLKESEPVPAPAAEVSPPVDGMEVLGSVGRTLLLRSIIDTATEKPGDK